MKTTAIFTAGINRSHAANYLHHLRPCKTLHEQRKIVEAAASNQACKCLSLHNATRERSFYCSLKLTDVFTVKLCRLVVERILGIWFVEQVDQPINDRIDIQNLPEQCSVGNEGKPWSQHCPRVIDCCAPFGSRTTSAMIKSYEFE